MNLLLQLLNENVDAKQTVALLFVWGVQIIVIVGLHVLRSEARRTPTNRIEGLNMANWQEAQTDELTAMARMTNDHHPTY